MSEEKKAGEQAGTREASIYAILSYVWVLCLVPLLLKKDNKFVMFHAKQGLMLFIVEVGLSIIGIVPILGQIVGTLGTLVCGLLSLVGIVQVLMGNEWKMPVIHEWAEKIKI